MLSAYHNWSVSDSVFRYDDLIFVLLPLWRLVLHVSDGDCQLDWTALIPSICSDDLPADVGPLEKMKRNYKPGVRNYLRLKMWKLLRQRFSNLSSGEIFENKTNKENRFTNCFYKLYFRNVKFGIVSASW